MKKKENEFLKYLKQVRETVYNQMKEEIMKKKSKKQKEFCVIYRESPISYDLVVDAKDAKEAVQKVRDVLGWRVAEIESVYELTNKGA